MAETVVKSVEIREVGAQRVYDRLDSLVQVSQRTVTAFNDVGQASETTGRRVSSSAREFDRYVERATGMQKGLRDYARDLRAIGAGLNTGGFGEGAKAVANYNSELRKVQQTLQDMGRPTGATTSFQGMIAELRGIDTAAKSAQESAEAMRVALNAIDTGRTSMQRTIDELHGIGQGALSARDSMDAFGALFQREAQESARAAAALASEVEQLRLAYDPVYAAAQRMGQELENLARLEREGIAILGGYDAALERIVLKYDEAAQAARRAADAQQAMIANARAEQNAASSQIAYNDMLGVRAGPRNSARDSGLVFKEDLDAADALAKRLAAVRAQIDPLAAAQDRYNAEIAEYIALNKQGLLSDSDLNQGLQVAATRLDQAERSLAGFNDTSRLGTLELTNLQYQLNDIAVSLASGQSPFTVMLQQGAQIGQLFGPGATVQDALKSVGVGIFSFITSPLNLAILGVAALAGSFALIYSAFNKSVKPLGDAMKEHKEAVSAVADAYGVAASEAEKFARASEDSLEFGVRRSRAQLEISARKSLRESFQPGMLDGITSDKIFAGRVGGEGRDAVRIYEQFAAFEEPLMRLLDGISKGTAKADEFVDEVARIANLDPANEQLQKAAERLIKLAAEAADAQRQLRGLSTEFARAAEQAKVFNAVADELGGFIPDTRTDVERIEQLYQQLMRLAKTEADVTRAEDLRRMGLDAIADAEKNRREQHQLSIAAINAQTVEEQAQIAERQTYLDLLGETLTEEERLRQSREAGDLVREQGRADETQRLLDYRDAVTAQTDSMNVQVETLRRQADMFGQSEGAIAAAEAQTRLLAEAFRLARENGQVVTPQQIADIETAAAEIGALTDQIARLREAQAQAERLSTFMADLDFDVSIAQLPDIEQDIQRQLRDLGIAYESMDGQRIAGQMRYLDSLDKTKDGLLDMRELAEDVTSTLIEGFANGENVLDSLISTFARLGQQLAAAGLDRLMGNLFGTGQPQGGASAGGVIGAVGQAANTFYANSRTGGAVDYTGFTAPLGRVERSVLPSLTRNADRFSVASDDLAGNIRLAAEELGVSARDIATVISYETGGTFDPWKKGPTTQWGTHRGLIQWGEPQAAKYGVSAMSTIAEQMQAAVRYWKDAGVKPGMGLLDVYSAVNAGRVGRYRASDANNGGAWGTVADKVNYQMGGHMANADRLLGGDVNVLARAVSTGYVDGTRKIATGGVPGLSAWGPQFNDTQTVSPMVMSSAGAGGGTNLLGGFAGAIGIGASAYQSGDPLGGALSGGLGGMELGSLLGIGGPAGMLLGAGIGLLGGLFGGKSKKKEEARQRKMAADQAWSDNYNSLLEYKDVVYRTPKGALTGQLTELERTLDQFAKLADATKDGGNKRHIEDIRDQLGRYSELLKSMFRDTLPTVLEDLSAGRGLDTAFTKARDSVQAEAEAYRGLIEDVKLSFQPDFSGRDAIIGDYKDQVASIEKQRRLAQNMARVGDLTVNGDGGINDPASDLPAKMKAFGENLVAAEIERDKAVAAWEAANADVQARYDEAVAKAVTAAREGLLRIVSGDVVEQSDIEAALAEARGAAAGLDVALKDLGMSAEEAATAIQGALAKRMALLAETFTRGLQDQIDELDGKGYLAGFRDLIEQRDTLLKDASLINVDTSLVSTFFQKQAQNLVDGAELAGDGFAELIKLFPELSGVVTESADAVEKLKDKLRAITERIEGYDERRFSAREDTSTLSGAMSAFNRRAARERYAEGLAGGEGMLALDAALAAEKVATIQGLLIQARQDEVSAIEDTINRLKGLRDEWKDLRDSLKLDDTLSPLSQYDQFLEAQKQFRDISAKAAAGDEDAQAKLAGISQSYLEEAKAYYASSEDYYAAFREVQGVLETAETLASRELAIAQSQLDVAKAQLDAMTGVKDSVATLAEALTVAMAALAGATKAATGGSTSGTSFVPKNDLEHFLGVQYGAILGRAPDAAGVAYYQALRDQGATADQLIAYIKNSPEAKARGYALGGLVSGPGTGMSDSIMARLSAGEFVMPARAVTPQTLPMLEGMRSGRMAGNDNAEMIAELRGLRAEVRSLRATVAEGELANVAATRAGVAAQQAAAIEQKKAASR